MQRISKVRLILTLLIQLHKVKSRIFFYYLAQLAVLICMSKGAAIMLDVTLIQNNKATGRWISDT